MEMDAKQEREQMEYLARMINPAKWELQSFMTSRGQIAADAITGCLRTQGNTLSFWESSKDKTDVEKVALALASARQKIDKLQIILIPRTEFPPDNFDFSKTDGNTPFLELRHKHMDMVNIDMTTLCQVAEKIAPKIRNNHEELLFQFTQKEVKRLIIQGVIDGFIEIDKLDTDIKKAIKNEID